MSFARRQALGLILVSLGGLLLPACRKLSDPPPPAQAEESASWVESRGPATTAPAAADAPDVLVILVDALRPDHLGCYGYHRETSPFLDRWAGEALRFDQAWTHASHTRMSIASLFTGTRPTVHRVRNVDLRADFPDDPDRLTDAVAHTLTTLPESLAGRGYEVWAHSANPHIAPQFGFGQGVTRWLQTKSRDGAFMADRFLGDLRRHREDPSARPLFAYLHLMDVHNPYSPKPPWDRAFRPKRGRVHYKNGLIDLSADDLAMTVSQYDGDIRYTDTLLERLLTAWEGAPGRPRVTVILSDHGEEFQEHGGLGHGRTVFDEQLRIALLAKGPGIPAGAHAHPVTMVDVHRLLLDATGAEVPVEAQGRPFAAWSSPDLHPPAIYAESRTGRIAFRAAGKALIFPRDDPSKAVWFDLVADPGQRSPRTDAGVIRELMAALAAATAGDDRVADGLGTPLRVPLDQETEEALKGLGYLGGP